MITAFLGVPGSGKSYDAVKKIVDNLKKKRVVYTDIEGMDSDDCQEVVKTLTGLDDYEFSLYFHFLQNWQVKEFWKHCKVGSLIVLDEVHKTFNARNYGSAENNEFANWASTHRHHGYDVVLITQVLEKVEKHVREIVEWCYLYKKNNFMGKMVQNTYLRYAYMDSGTDGRPLKRSTHAYDKKIFHCYKSFAAKDIKEQDIMPRINILNKPVIWAIPFLIAFALYMVFFKSSLGTGDLFGISKYQKELDAKQKGVVKKDGVVAAGKVVPPVMVPKEASAVTIPVVMAPACS